jgi:hypothetical protein
VRIRNRNPWVLARRRLFGWKVRLPLLTVDLPASDYLGVLERSLVSPAGVDTRATRA